MTQSTQPREERCLRTDLPTYSCSHCRGHREEPKAKYGELYKSTKPLTCSSCDHSIKAGDRIATDGQGGHVCEDCQKEEAASNTSPDEIHL